MPVEVANGAADTIVHPNGDLTTQNPNAASKKSKESERRRRRRKQKKNKEASKVVDNGDDSGSNAVQDANGGAEDSSKENPEVLSVFWIFLVNVICLGLIDDLFLL